MIHQCYGESIAMTKIITKIQVFPGRLEARSQGNLTISLYSETELYITGRMSILVKSSRWLCAFQRKQQHKHTLGFQGNINK